MSTAAARWRELQQGRGIPEEILAAAPTDPWRHDPALFRPPDVPEDTPSRTLALELLGEPGGTVLDVGCGAGAAALALADRARHVSGLDTDEDMLAAFAAGCRERGVPHRTLRGAWPDTAADAGVADVVVCHHVVHNTTELAPFIAALGTASRRGVVVEMFAEHPLAWLDPLWERFHGLVRPPSATADDAIAVLAEIGIDPAVTRWERARSVRPVEWITRQLCLPAERSGEVAAALAAQPPRARSVVTLRW